MMYQGPNQEQLFLLEITSQNCQLLEEKLPSFQTLVWFKSESKIVIDGKEEIFQPNQILCLTEVNKVNVKSIGLARMVRFNRYVYCVLDHDSEVGCNGLLFFG